MVSNALISYGILHYPLIKVLPSSCIIGFVHVKDSNSNNNFEHESELISLKELLDILGVDWDSSKEQPEEQGKFYSRKNKYQKKFVFKEGVEAVLDWLRFNSNFNHEAILEISDTLNENYELNHLCNGKPPYVEAIYYSKFFCHDVRHGIYDIDYENDDICCLDSIENIYLKTISDKIKEENSRYHLIAREELSQEPKINLKNDNDLDEKQLKWIRNELESLLGENISLDEVNLAKEVQLIWKNYPDFHINSNILGNFTDYNRQNYIHFHILGWKMAIKIIKSFDSLPESGEIERLLIELFDNWYSSIILRSYFFTFYEYIRYRFLLSSFDPINFPSIPFDENTLLNQLNEKRIGTIKIDESIFES